MKTTGTVVYLVSRDVTRVYGITELLRPLNVNVIFFSSTMAYLSAKREDEAACLLVDLNIPDATNVDLRGHFSDRGTPPPVVFLTDKGDTAACVRAVKNGAIDVLIEPFVQKDLLDAVSVALARDQRRRREQLERTSLLTKWRSLTPRETEVFHHTVAGLLNKQAAAELGVAENTYQVHRGRVMRKMQANSLADLVRMSVKLEPILKKTDRTSLLATHLFRTERPAMSF